MIVFTVVDGMSDSYSSGQSGSYGGHINHSNINNQYHPPNGHLSNQRLTNSNGFNSSTNYGAMASHMPQPGYGQQGYSGPYPPAGGQYGDGMLDESNEFQQNPTDFDALFSGKSRPSLAVRI